MLIVSLDLHKLSLIFQQYRPPLTPPFILLYFVSKEIWHAPKSFSLCPPSCLPQSVCSQQLVFLTTPLSLVPFGYLFYLYIDDP